MVVAGIAGVAIAALAGIAVAKSFTLGVSKNAKVTSAVTGVTKHEDIVSLRGVSVYTLSGDSKSHQECTNANGCFGVWPPATVPSKNTKLTKAPGVKGTVGIWHEGSRFRLTLDNHPLYNFAGDLPKKGVANGEGITHFGGTWHVVKASSTSKGTKTTTTGTTTTTTTSTSTSTTSSCVNPPYCY